jgi:hypothetical protein
MITNFKCTTVNEELNIMNMDQGKDWEWCMHPDIYEEMEEKWILDEYKEIQEAKAKGQILNPYYDEDYTYRCWKYDKPITDPFIHIKWVTKEELEAYNLSFELYRRMLDAKEEDEDIVFRWNENAA